MFSVAYEDLTQVNDSVGEFLYQVSHGIRNEIVASKQKSREHVASTSRQDEGRRGEKSEKRKEY